MIHLAASYRLDPSGRKNTGSEASSPDNRPGARRMREATEKCVFNIGHITPNIHDKVLEPFHERARSLVPKRLCQNIREDMGYTKESLSRSQHPQSELEKYILVEKISQIALDTYNGATRDNGHPVVSHPLGAGAIGAATGEQISTILVDIGHDFFEDVRDGRHPEIVFRAKSGGVDVEYRDPDMIAKYIRDPENFGRYGKGMARDIWAVTRPDGNGQDGKSWQRAYKEYLVGMQQFINAVLAKANDSYVNLLDLHLVPEERRHEMAQKLVMKAAWQAERLKRISWKKACLLQSAIAAVPEGKACADRLNDINEYDIAKFERGWALNPERQFNVKLFKSVHLSGSPSIDIYPAKDTRFGKYEIELPFVQDQGIALQIIRDAFGCMDGEIRRAQSLLPSRLSSAMIFNFQPKGGDFEAQVGAALREYDHLLNKGLLLPQLEGFDRKEWAKAARERMERKRHERTVTAPT